MILLQVSGFQPDKIALFLITLVRNFFSDLLPARLGTLIYIYLVQSRLGVPFGAAASSFSFAFIYDIIALALLVFLAGCIGFLVYTTSGVILGAAALLGMLSLGVLIILPTLLSYSSKIVLSLPLLSPKYTTQLSSALVDMRHNLMIANEKKIQLRLLFLSLGVRWSKYLALYFLLLALVTPLGYSVAEFPLPTVFLGLCSAEIAASLPISGIAGFGAYEGTWSLVFQLLGYPQHISVLTSISHHLTTQLYGYSLGAFALLILMIPVFKKTNIQHSVKMNKKDYFWRNLLISSSILLSLTFVFLFQQNLFSQPKDNYHPVSDNASSPTLANPIIQSLEAKIVFQRPDGIYSVKVGENKPNKIADYGSHPRWSPDGKWVTFVHNNMIMLIGDSMQKPRQLAIADKAKAVCFRPDGKAVIFTDGKYLREVEIESGKINTLLKDKTVKEVDISANGKRLAITARSGFGYKVMVYDPTSGSLRTVASGCSASLSPDGNLVTVNAHDHKKLHMYKWDTLKIAGYVSSPPKFTFDNQFWSNNSQWLVSTSDGKTKNIFIHHVSSNSSFQVTTSGDCDRADMFVQNNSL